MDGKKRIFAFLSTVVLTVALAVSGCGSEPAAQQSSGSSASRARSTGLYYSGDGGKGKSLSVLTPVAGGLAQDESYLPALIQGVLVSDFSKFSSIAVTDRQAQDKLLAELEDGRYAENDLPQYGQILPSGSMLSGGITKAAQDYLLRLTVQDTKTMQVLASYTGSADRAGLDNFSAIKKASEDLLGQMGITLTNAGREALHGADQKERGAETALARGITAQRGGTIIEAMSFLYEAASLDPSLTEATQRASTLSAAVQSGNLGEDIRNEIALRNRWRDVIRQCAAYFDAHIPYEIIYEPVLKMGTIDYDNETASLSFPLMLRPTTQWKVLQDVQAGVDSIPQSQNWGDEFSQFVSNIAGRSIWDPYTLNYIAELLAENGEVIASTEGGLAASVFTEIYYWKDSARILSISNNDRRLRVTGKINPAYPYDPLNSMCVFRKVPAQKISDSLTIRITRVGRPVSRDRPVTIYTDLTQVHDYIRVIACAPGKFPSAADFNRYKDANSTQGRGGGWISLNQAQLDKLLYDFWKF